MKRETFLQYVLILGMVASILSLLLGFIEAGALILLLTPIVRNSLSCLWSLFESDYLFAFFAFLTVAIILFT